MIFAHVDTAETQNIIGFEIGTRADFDNRHGTNPLWVFLDLNIVKYRASFPDFLRNPTAYHIDSFGNLQIT